MNEEVAILLTTYNGEDYISEQIESIMSQTYQDFVCYIHDDGSSDHTREILDKFEKRFKDKIIILEYPRQGCPRDNFLSMINYVDAPYIMFSDQDDYWMPDKIKKTLEYMKAREQENKNCGVVVYSDVKVVDEKLNTIANSYYTYADIQPYATSLSELIMHNVALGCTMMINRSLYCLYRKAELYTIGNHDWLFMLLAASCGVVCYIPEQLMLYRQHSNNCVGVSEGSGLIQKVISMSGPHIMKRQIRKTKETIERQRKRAGELLCFELPDNKQKDFLNELHNIGSKSKLERIRFYISKHLYTNQNFFIVLLMC